MGNRETPVSYNRAAQTAAAYTVGLVAAIPVNEMIVIVGFLLHTYRRCPAHIEWVCTLYVRQLQNNEV